jgi:hypothetical protein
MRPHFPMAWQPRCVLTAALLLCGTYLSWAQDPAAPRTFQPYTPVDTPQRTMPRAGQVDVNEDPAVMRLMQQYREKPMTRPGYRVQIFLGERSLAEEQKRIFLQRHPEVPAYLSWLAPNFRLRVGDLRTRLEAERLLNELREQFPGSYVVPDEIEMPRPGI